MGEVRCLNCLKRFPVNVSAIEAACPHCKTRYRISWPRPDQPKIRGLAKEQGMRHGLEKKNSLH